MGQEFDNMSSFPSKDIRNFVFKNVSKMTDEKHLPKLMSSLIKTKN
jgi:hypothetical protein